MGLQADLFSIAVALVDSLFPSHRRLPGDNWHYERLLAAQGYLRVAGCDEAGRGPLAGPVVAACVILPPDSPISLFVDSKTLSAKKREAAYRILKEVNAEIGVAVIDAPEIDRLNILQASLQAMSQAAGTLVKGIPDYLLVDGKFQVPLALAQQALIKGESKSASIAAASIVAKVSRDKIMEDYDRQYPQYGFARHMGYPTREHRQAIARHGASPIHRHSFKGVREYVEPKTESWPAG